ncbi:hypothetical protein [Streptomyces mirabilis]|uniref:hypothetical protein n=1 Tax=Streptomyces mirabilis TaxID=68239 RepID=UPI0033349891
MPDWSCQALKRIFRTFSGPSVGGSDCLRDQRAEAAEFAARPGSTLGGDELIDRVVAPIVYRVVFLPWTLPKVDARTYVGELCDRSA